MSELKVSVVVTSYNYARYIKETLQSLVEQTYPHFEVIVVDDGSTDDSISVIQEFCKKDDRVKLFQHENGENKGLSKSVIYGIFLATGDYICFCESDDFFHKEYLEEKVKYIKKYPQTEVIINAINYFGKEDLVSFKSQEFIPLFNVLKSIKKPKNIHYDLIHKGNRMVFATFSIVMVKADKLKSCDFNVVPELSTAIDIWLWKQLILRCKVGYIDKKLTNWRLHSASIVQTAVPVKWDNFYEQLNKILMKEELIIEHIKSNDKNLKKIFLKTEQELLENCLQKPSFIQEDLNERIESLPKRTSWFYKQRIRLLSRFSWGKTKQHYKKKWKKIKWN